VAGDVLASTLDAAENRRRADARGARAALYIAPERLASSRFRRRTTTCPSRCSPSTKLHRISHQDTTSGRHLQLGDLILRLQPPRLLAHRHGDTGRPPGDYRQLHMPQAHQVLRDAR
jgi:hypothetical protein